MINIEDTPSRPLNQSVEMTSLSAVFDEEQEALEMNVVQSHWSEVVITLCGVIGLTAICLVVIGLFTFLWINDTSYRAWLLFAGIVPLFDAV